MPLADDSTGRAAEHLDLETFNIDLHADRLAPDVVPP